MAQHYDGQNEPCELCGKPVVVSAFTGQVVHHRCEWRSRRSEGALAGALTTSTPPNANQKKVPPHGTP